MPTRPDCHTDDATERCGWAWDRGRSCAQHATPELARVIGRYADCTGCARAQRARDISARIVTADEPERRGTVGRETWVDTLTAEAQAQGFYDDPPMARCGAAVGSPVASE